MVKVRNIVLPATVVRKGFRNMRQRNLNAAYPGAGTSAHVLRSDFAQYQVGAILYFNVGVSDLTTSNSTIGNAIAGA